MSHYYDRSNLQKLPELISLAPQAAASFQSFEKDVYHSSQHIPLQTKELIAVAVAHVTGCPYCIDVHVKKFKELGGTREEIFEAVLVAASTRAGAILSHATHALSAYDENMNTHNDAPLVNPPNKPDCFC
jgi:AhpD family alkylhydroperoxidase